MKKNKTHSFLFFIMLAMLTFMLTACVVGDIEEPSKNTHTIMLFVTGSDLEADSGLATWNMVQAMEAEYDENLNFVVMTGGSVEWQMKSEYLDGVEAIDADYNQIWLIEGKREGETHGKMKLLEPTGLVGVETMNLTKTEPMVAFINYCYENYPADHYDLILWDHGCAFTRGFGFDDRFYDWGPMSIPDMIAGIAETKLIKDGKKFEIVNFDACYMGAIEVAAAFAPYADYLVASAESEPGYGQEYTSWLNAVKDNPNMDGFELGKLIVDGLVSFYSDYYKTDATLSVIDLKNFTEILMPLIGELDDIMIREAKILGEKNGRYNFYDEIYSLHTAFNYSGDCCLYDYGTFVGGLSSPQSEMDNADDDEINSLTNAYTETALKILAVLADDDGSGDDVLYAAYSTPTFKVVDPYYVRGLDGEFLQPDENGQLTIYPTGFNCFFGDGNLPNEYTYLDQIFKAFELMTDETTLSFLERRGLVVSYYSLISQFGRFVSALSDETDSPVTMAEVKETYKASNDTFVTKGIPKMMKYISDHDDDFASFDEVEAYFSRIVDQQAGEALKNENIIVKKLVSPDGSSDFYQVTIHNASSQSLMKLYTKAYMNMGNYKSPEFDVLLHELYDDKTYEELFDYGVYFYTPDYIGTLDHYHYYEDYYDSDADIYQRVYSDPTSVWIVPEVYAYCFVLTDENGDEHPAKIQYADSSNIRANIPIMLILANNKVKNANILISFGENGWQADGISLSEDGDRSFYPMDSDMFIGAKYTTSADPVNNSSNSWVPSSQFCNIDISKKNWGISLGWKRIDEVEEIIDYGSICFAGDVYGYSLDIGYHFDEACDMALTGDVAYMIGCVDFSIAEAVYDGSAKRPKVTAYLKDVELTEGVDFKVLYDGSSNPGEAHLIVVGIGNFYGALDLAYTIKDSI